MNRHVCFASSVVLALAFLGGCSSKPSEAETKKASVTLQKIKGRIQLLTDNSGTVGDSALNPGGPAIYLWEGTKRYRLFVRKPTEFSHGQQYQVEGINAQQMIDEIGDATNGKSGYPLQTPCEKVIRAAWTGMAFDAVDANASILRARIARYPARPVFLVVNATQADPEKVKPAEKDPVVLTVPADKQKAALKAGEVKYMAPLWEPAGGTVKCKIVVDTEGKVSDLETGAQLCEAVDWNKFQYEPAKQGTKLAHVRTEVEITYEARK